jgi:iron complex outermembrane receptor protein
MNIHTVSRRAFARRMLVVACASALSVPALSFAQAAAAPPPDQGSATHLDTVTVTGTRISNPNVVNPTPISTLTADDIKASGAINIGDILTTLPQLATSFTMGNSSQFIGTAGIAMQDLRNLGSQRTLVLVNGRRFVGSSAGSTAVDTNLIPADWVERVEIITGGASAVYGADAVTGVVNFVLKKKYQGVALNAQYGTSEHGGFDKKFISLTGGTNFAGDRGNIAVAVEHSNQGALEFNNRWGSQNYRSVLTPNGPTDARLFSNAGNYTVTDSGTFSLGGTTDINKRYVFDRGGNVRKQRFDGIYDNAGNCADCDYLNLNDVAQLQPRYGRTTLSGVGSFDITPDHRLYFEGTYSHVDVKSFGQPAFGSGSSAYAITPDNAYVSPELAALMGGDNINVARFDTDAGRRGEDTKRDTARGVLGINGLMTDDWEYDASVVYGETRETRYNLNNRINERFYASIDAVTDPTTGNVVCRSTLDPSSINPNTGAPISDFARQGCVPTSIFGNGAISPEAARWFNTTTKTTSKLTQFVGGGTLTNNNLFALPGGSASLVVGTEFRRESSRQGTDPLDVSGQTFLNAIPGSGGSYNVKEGFTEIALPLLSNKTLVKNLTVDAALRVSDYTTIGRTTAWRYGLDWSIDDNVRLRGTMSSAVRAPNIDELFSGQSQNFFSVTDPCSVNQLKNAKDPAVRAANCKALGVPEGYQSNNGATVEGVSGSNPGLRPEKGNTWTTGIVLTPQFLPGFGVTADYWNIKLTDAISSISGNDTVNRCVDSPSGIDNSYCGSVRRDPVTNEVIFIETLVQNISALKTSGIDFGTYYSHPLFGGRMNWNLDATRVISYQEFPFQEDKTQSIQDNGVLGFPEWKAVLRARYTLQDWRFDWSARYISSMLRVSNESFASNPTSITPVRTGSRTYSDVKVAYSFPKSGWQAYVGINNLFDRDPPVNQFGTTFGSGLYDGIGRSYFAGFNYRFL